MQQHKINRDFVSPFRYAGFGVGTPQQELSDVILWTPDDSCSQFSAPCKGTQILSAKSSVLHLAFDDTAGIPAK